MKLSTAPVDLVEMGGVVSAGQFRIRNSAKAFSILSSGLYANKPLAIVRELSCNAYDSHVAAGKKDVPFDLHLPTVWEPFFAIRDYGTGLNHDQVINIYTTYFESTKTQSNDFIGALGLGSKSPFSYTDNFSVTAFKDGVKRNYSAFIDDTGVPSIALLEESETSEPNGVEVKFAISNRDDFYKFENSAAHALTYFDPIPNFTGAAVVVNKPTYRTEIELPDGIRQMSRRQSVAVMGNIAYPIELPKGSIDNGLQDLLNCGLELTFNIGELDFQASREGLSYIPMTIDAIKTKLTFLRDSLKDLLETAIKQWTGDKWEKTEKMMELASQAMWRAAIDSYLTAHPDEFHIVKDQYKQWAVFSREITEYDAAEFNAKIDMFTLDHRGSPVQRKMIIRAYDYKTQAYKPSYHFNVNSGIRFVVADEKIGSVEKTKYNVPTLLKDNRRSAVYLIRPVNPNMPIDPKFWDMFANPDSARITKSSDLVKKPVSKTAPSVSTGPVQVMRMTESYRGDWIFKPVAIDLTNPVDVKNKKYYINVSGYAPTDALFKGISIPKLMDLLSETDTTELIVDVYAIRKGATWVNDRADWVKLEDHLNEFFNKYVATVESVKAAANISHQTLALFEQRVANKVAKTSPYRAAAERAMKIRRLRELSTLSITRVMNFLKINMPAGKPDQTVVDDIAFITTTANRYPVIFNTLTYIRTEHEHIYTDYIKFIDTHS